MTEEWMLLSSDHATEGIRPKLAIDYFVGGETMTEIRLTPESVVYRGWAWFVGPSIQDGWYKLTIQDPDNLEEVDSDFDLSPAVALALAREIPEVQALVKAIRAVEWISNFGVELCPWCLACYPVHMLDCDRQVALAALEAHDEISNK